MNETPTKRGRGRPAIPGPKVTVRITQATFTKLEAAARAAGKPRATWLRELIERTLDRG